MATKKNIDMQQTSCCLICGKEYSNKNFYYSKSKTHSYAGRIPYCKECIDNMYRDYCDKYGVLGYADPERKAVERLCMIFDLYYSDKIYDSALKQIDDGSSTASAIAAYIRMAKLRQHQSKNYDTTLEERYNDEKYNNRPVTIYSEQDTDINNAIDAATKLFGNGFDDNDYLYLYGQYMDWTARHECNTKSQEETFKRICITQLQLLKADRRGEESKALNETYLKLLDAAKLQPKQNSGDTTADNQTFGTLIDKWENTRPIPETDEELRDVDNIAWYIDVFFRGHLSKMMGLKNGFSKLYDKFMKKYTVEKPEYNADEDDEALFEAVFGTSDLNDDDVDVLDGYAASDDNG